MITEKCIEVPTIVENFPTFLYISVHFCLVYVLDLVIRYI